MAISSHDDDSIPVAEAARRLGVSERHIGRLTAAWAKGDLALLYKLVLELRSKNRAIELRKLQRSVRHTRTGKLKKRFREQQRQAPYQNCLDCGTQLASVVREYWEEPYEEAENDGSSDRRRPTNGIRTIPVEYKRAGKRAVAHHVQLDIGHVLKNMEAAANAPAPKLVRYQLRYCRNPTCRQYNEPVKQYELENRAALDELFEHDEEIDERSIQAAIDELNGHSPGGRDDE